MLKGDDIAKMLKDSARKLMPVCLFAYEGLCSWLCEAKRISDSDADEFGMSMSFIEFCHPIFQFMYYDYFRVEAVGVHNIPAGAPAILVANHSGTLPYDGVMSHLAVYNRHRQRRIVRFLVDDFVFRIPFLRTFISRTGGVPATFENAMKLLRRGNAVMIFPEGVDGIGKTYDERYRLRPFARGGFIRLAIKTGAPVIPVSVIGAEEIHPLIWKSEELGKMFGVPFVPFTPTFPWLGPLGLVPLPSKWKIIFGKPIAFDRYKPADARNDKLVGKLAEKVRGIIQKKLDGETAKRKSIWV
jgi:1-acyl-sn-glycerol-3-phosphate acyltransferase